MPNSLQDVLETQTLSESYDVNSWLKTGKWIIIDIYHVCDDPENDPNTVTPQFVLGRIKN